MDVVTELDMSEKNTGGYPPQGYLARVVRFCSQPDFFPILASVGYLLTFPLIRFESSLVNAAVAAQNSAETRAAISLTQQEMLQRELNATAAEFEGFVISSLNDRQALLRELYKHGAPTVACDTESCWIED